MATDDRFSPREALLSALMRKVEAERYPSSTMLDVIESLLTEDDVPGYVNFLVAHIDDDRFPSIPMIHRVEKFA